MTPHHAFLLHVSTHLRTLAFAIDARDVVAIREHFSLAAAELAHFGEVLGAFCDALEAGETPTLDELPTEGVH